jgi:hypothetical protein
MSNTEHWEAAQGIAGPVVDALDVRRDNVQARFDAGMPTYGPESTSPIPPPEPGPDPEPPAEPPAEGTGGEPAAAPPT